MEVDEETVEKDVYVLLNFKEKIEQKFFTKNNLFFKMVNLHTKKPFIQLGSHVFNGTYEDASFGTNLFFEEQDEPRDTSIYEEQTPIHLKFIGKTTKILTLRWQKIPDEIIDVDSKELIDLDFREPYETVLNKIENESLDINDVVKQNEPEEIISESVQTQAAQEATCIGEYEVPLQNDDAEEEQDETPKSEKSEVVTGRYNLLKQLVAKSARPPEYLDRGNLENITTDRDFSILKELYLKSLDHKKLSLKYDAKNISAYVDVEASIKDKIICDKEIDKLTDRDKQMLISLKNFDNLSIPMKLTLLIEHIKEEKQHMATLRSEELQVLDEYGRTVKDRYRLLKSLAKDIQYYMFLRIRNNNCNRKVIE